MIFQNDYSFMRSFQFWKIFDSSKKQKIRVIPHLCATVYYKFVVYSAVDILFLMSKNSEIYLFT